MLKRFLSLLFVLALVVGCFVACDNGDGGKTDGDDDYDGTLGSLNFGGETLEVCVSACQDKEVSFRPGNIYTKGPDNGSTSEPIAKKVLVRNKKVADDMNMTIALQI